MICSIIKMRRYLFVGHRLDLLVYLFQICLYLTTFALIVYNVLIIILHNIYLYNEMF